MRPSIVLIGVVSLQLWAGTALADMKGYPDQQPTFSAAESEVISRNELLATIVVSDPWLVRRTLDRLAGHNLEDEAPTTRAVPVSPDGFDPTRNPDLSGIDRNSAEAAYDLFQLIKKAAAEKQKR